MNKFQNNQGFAKGKSKFSRLITPGIIILAIIIIGVIILLLPNNNADDLKGTANAQQGTIDQPPKKPVAIPTNTAQNAKPKVAVAIQQEATEQTTKPTDTSSDVSNNTEHVSNESPVSETTELPAFDITKRLEQPPIDNEANHIQWMLANTSEKEVFLKPKWERMLAIKEKQDISDPRIIEAFLRTPREFFCDAGSPAKAYANAVIPIGYGQTISGPHLVSNMTQAIDPQPNQKVLEVGTGSGYQSAILSELSNYVYTIEIVPQLAQKVDELYTKLSKNYPEYANIKRKNADGYYGWAEYAPFDRIIVTAGIDHVPPDLLKQLSPNGIMVIPVGPPSGQTILKISKEVMDDGSVNFKREDIYHGRKVIFVPFTSEQGIHSTTSDNIQNP
jgi:protein-L-isoaspartate(D-aspartate) O-methyltransferase